MPKRLAAQPRAARAKKGDIGMRMIVLVGTLATALATTVSVPEAAADHLRGYWKLDEAPAAAANDSSTGMHNGTPNNVIQSLSGKSGNALEFGAKSQVLVPNSPELEPEQITVEAWVKAETPGISSPFGYIVAKGANDCHYASYGLYTVAKGDVAFYVGSGGAFYRSQIADSKDVWDGEWHHLTGTYDGDVVRLCLDGVEMGEGIAPLPRPPSGIEYGLTTSNDLFIGHFNGQGGGACTGGWSDQMPVIIDEVKIWDVPKNCGEGCAGRKHKHCWLRWWK